MSIADSFVRRQSMATPLLNDDGTASMATVLMSSHHAFRRDIGCFARALAHTTSSQTLTEEWARFRGALHGHHLVEDTSVFPDLRGKQPELATRLDTLDSHHRAIDPLLERGDKLFAALATERPAALELIGQLASLLDEHLDLEERTIIPHLRGAKEFPPPPSDDMIALYADGFAWSAAGLAEPVVAKIFAMLPPALVAKLPAARAAFDERSRRVWGYTHTGASLTSIP
jgi:hypothetical protein